ncbi:hypothetical protein BDV28DRAFT_71969 [Aspergillus coremiiformis]|uniref:Uncharacterized protein n=1 Tax=Aspergillus coremiiformis TaxID=138285 RepID=A0A5N6YU72_9EURO|nr:hypothetical protein BDV28DRAFT_71969 [Aspergillus coremiiformis]
MRSFDDTMEIFWEPGVLPNLPSQVLTRYYQDTGKVYEYLCLDRSPTGPLWSGRVAVLNLQLTSTPAFLIKVLIPNLRPGCNFHIQNRFFLSFLSFLFFILSLHTSISLLPPPFFFLFLPPFSLLDRKMTRAYPYV